MPRNFPDFLSAYTQYAGFSEAPKRMHFWTGVSAVAGALRRRVWIDMAYFKWHANHYIVFVAPPGIVSKSTTVAIGMDLLRKVPGVVFGPDVVTWPALVTAFAACTEVFNVGAEAHVQCALTLESSEFGNLVNPQDREMIDLLVTLWDSRQGVFKKVTKSSGVDQIENPWINMIACTTPSWVAGNFPEYVIGGGFTSRCLFVYTDQKEKYVAYPHLAVPSALGDVRHRLIQDLEHISTLAGPYSLTPEALDWGKLWYEVHYQKPPENLTDDRFQGYLARKQTHLHKLAMVVSASRNDSLLITKNDMVDALGMLSDLEYDMPKVFAKIGRSEESIQTEKLINFVHRRGRTQYHIAYQHVHSHFPRFQDFQAIVNGAVRAGYIKEIQGAGQIFLEPILPLTLKPISPSTTETTDERQHEKIDSTDLGKGKG